MSFINPSQFYPEISNYNEYHLNDTFPEINQIENDAFLEHACVHGKHYGTLKREVDKHINAGYDVILEIDILKIAISLCSFAIVVTKCEEIN